MPNVEFCVWQKISICPQNTWDTIAETKSTSQQKMDVAVYIHVIVACAGAEP